MTHIYYSYIQEERHNWLLNNMLPDFPRDYQNKIQKYRRWQDAQLSLLGKLLLKHGLHKFDKKANSDNLFFNINSKPYLKTANIEFNISHSGNIVLCAISNECEIGIDIEQLKEIEIDDFKDQMTINEWKNISQAEDRISSFFDYWTQKEAVLKAYGSGFSIPLKSFENINYATQINGYNFYLKEIKIGEKYKCYIAFNGKEATGVTLHEIESLELF